MRGNGTGTCINAPEAGLSLNLSSKAYDVYAHLREGKIVPLQDGKTIVVDRNVTNVKGLNLFPVELHVNPR